MYNNKSLLAEQAQRVKLLSVDTCELKIAGIYILRAISRVKGYRTCRVSKT